MKLKLEKDISVAVEINGGSFISSSEGVLYQYISDNDDEILLYIKSEKDPKELKIKITKNVSNES